jgi:glycosyltransferase involved in cell wall biosynthesis
MHDSDLNPSAKAGRTPRVAHFLPHYPSREGTTSFCRGLMRALNEMAPESCRVITLRPGVKAEHPGDLILCYPNPSALPFSLPEPLKADILSNAHRLDGLVLHGTYNPATVAMRHLAKRAGIPYIFIPHDPYPPALRRHHAVRKWVFWHLFESRLIRDAAAVQLLDETHERYLRELGCSASVEVIPNGCEVENLNHLPDPLPRPGSARPLRMLFLGRVDRNHKGLDLLIEGFARWRSEPESAGHELELVITGKDWGDRGELKHLADSLGVGDRVSFTGERKEHALEILAEADLVVLPSRFDGFGLCIVEAMMAGRPVLVSTQAGVSSHVARSGGGWLIEPDVDDIRKGIATALQSLGNWPAMGAKGREYVLEQLTWDHAAQRSIAIYRRHFLGARSV